MANIQAGDRFKAPYAGEVGNMSVWSGYHKMPAAGLLGDTIELCEVPAGAKIFGADMAWTAGGGAATLTVGWKYKDGSAGGSATAIKGSTSTVSAGNDSFAFLPITVDKPAIVYVTNGGTLQPINTETFVAVRGEFVGTP